MRHVCQGVQCRFCLGLSSLGYAGKPGDEERCRDKLPTLHDSTLSPGQGHTIIHMIEARNPKGRKFLMRNALMHGQETVQLLFLFPGVTSVLVLGACRASQN